MLDLRKLMLLREVAVHAGISHAARALGISPSSISQQITRLEEQAGVQLLQPAGRGVRLTPEAIRLVDHTETILATLEEAQVELADTKAGIRGVVQLVAFHTFAIELLGPVIAHLCRLAPALTIAFAQLDPEEAINELSARRADIAVADEYAGIALPPTKGLHRAEIGREPICAFTPYATTDLEALSWAMEPRHSDSFRWTRNVCRAAGFEPKVRFVSPDPFAHRRLVEQGLAAAFLPATVARGLAEPAVPVTGVLPTDLHRTLVTLVRRGTEVSEPIRACRTAIELAYQDAGVCA
ncbi:DNA-binding transcriptional LysR family regulator [Mycobacterium frederiksbergense]|uniref:DNA-binding transcriptional LysR family regulator n=1 Tax=Mycolicibacterium frederiksbergense TaxID=117567 RepID=A0ABT6KXW0_9MYCO|nr:LysR family transcriptional regulator [Mycolicibacterium frederiksbergense]MDH6195514.1 DNA-binding transcriptional LysR family regulator [Mycolicibacterium frederiksbergense]